MFGQEAGGCAAFVAACSWVTVGYCWWPEGAVPLEGNSTFLLAKCLKIGSAIGVYLFANIIAARRTVLTGRGVSLDTM